MVYFINLPLVGHEVIGGYTTVMEGQLSSQPQCISALVLCQSMVLGAGHTCKTYPEFRVMVNGRELLMSERKNVNVNCKMCEYFNARKILKVAEYL